jgi:mRNA-degrading endonuclease HigB of HigAB toxin-antitoxin module
MNESKNIVGNEEFVYLEDKIVFDTDCAKSEMVTYIAFSEDVT